MLALGLAAATMALYAPVLGHRFVVWDDHEYVTANPHLRSGLGWTTIKWAFTSTYASNWHPLTWLSHALDYQLFALNPWGHHFSNVLLHALNAVLLFLLLAWMTRRTGPSLLVAALFAVHPLNVESVAWVAERKNVLSTLFFLWAIGAYVWYARKPSWRRYLLVAALLATGLMAKPMVITLPFVLLLLDYWPLGRTPGSAASAAGAQPTTIAKLVLEKVPLLVLSAASGWITFVAQRSGFAVRNLQEFPLAARIENAPVAYALYLWKVLWPARLAALYPHPANGLPLWQVVLTGMVLIAITTLVLIFRDKRYLAVGWFWFLGTLVPVIGLVQVGEAAMADRYAYVPLVGIFIMIAWTLDDWADAKKVGMAWRLIPALCALALVTFRQIDVWRSEYRLWAHTVALTEWNPYAHAMLGAALLHPDVAMSAGDLEELDTEPKRLDEARRQYEVAASSYRQLAQQNPKTYLPELAGALSDLGNVYGRQEQPDEARRHYEEALQDYRQLEQEHPGEYLPFLAAVLSALGQIDQTQNRPDEARAHYEEALAIYGQLSQEHPGKYQSPMEEIVINLSSLK